MMPFLGILHFYNFIHISEYDLLQRPWPKRFFGDICLTSFIVTSHEAPEEGTRRMTWQDIPEEELSGNGY